ncbi:HIT family protein [archaeon]|nr:HIT family protein [archaeon]
MGECKYCKIVDKKTNLLYEDDNIIAVLPEKPATQGHVQIISKKHHTSMQKMDDKELGQMFYAASFSASALFETMEAHGTNIMANIGSLFKEGGHFHIDVIARKSGDELNFIWTPQKLPEEEMTSAQGKITDKCDLIGYEKKKEVIDLDNKKIEKIESGTEKKEEVKEEKTEHKTNKDIEEGKESYLVRQLKRMP